MWDPPRPGIEPVPPELAGGFFTTESPGKPGERFFLKKQEKRPLYAVKDVAVRGGRA